MKASLQIENSHAVISILLCKLSKNNQTVLLAEPQNLRIRTYRFETNEEPAAVLPNEDIVLDESDKELNDNNALGFNLELPTKEKPKSKTRAKTKSVKKQPKSKLIN